MTKIRGRYPGGPKRAGAADDGEPSAPAAPRLQRVEELEERLARASQAGERRRRARRVWSGLVIAVVLSGSIGLVLGYRSHRSSEELTAERGGTSASPKAFDPSIEINRMMLELWEMEDKQRMENGRR